ncbi:hypothetical protein AB0C33_29800 [Nonomuraea sp. NPDC048881]|uniref:hypothetical protein n=1 Tax=Nonomuraea sp. NPDC048881 TaxID=3155030 RepID=UPI0033FE7244
MTADHHLAAPTTPDTGAPPQPPTEAPTEAESGREAEGGGTAAVGGGTAAVGGWFTRGRVLGALAAMLAAAVAAAAVPQWIDASRARDALARLERERALRLEVSGAASAFGQALLSYDYKDLQSTRSTLSAQATGDFQATYDAAFGGATSQVIVKLKAVSQATVREVYLADADAATAHAIVVVDQQVNTAQAIRSVKDSHLKITLVKQKGAWKVQDVTVLGAASQDQHKLDDPAAKKD